MHKLRSMSIYESAMDSLAFSSLPSPSSWTTNPPRQSIRSAENTKAASMFSAILRLIRFLITRIAIGALIITMFIHEPTFQVFHDGLFFVHIVVRNLYLHLRILFESSTEDSTNLTTWLASYGHEFLVFSAPTLRPVLPWTTRVCMQVVHLSPKYLCYVNEGMVEAGKYVVDIVMGKDAGELKEMWKVAGKEVAGFCKAELTIWSAVGL